MVMFVGIPLACWWCALLAVPGRPRLGNEVEELVYVRLLGRQQRLVLLACVVTALTFMTVVLMLPAQMTLDERAVPMHQVACIAPVWESLNARSRHRKGVHH